MFTIPRETKVVDWKEMDGKFLKIRVAPPNLECNEPVGQVFGMDDKGNFYLIHEWTIPSNADERSYGLHAVEGE